jgi:hypothetical protein
MLALMRRARSVALAGAVVVVGAAATTVVVLLGGGDAGRPRADTDRIQRDVSGRLPAGWSSHVTADRDTVDVWLMHRGDITSTIASMRRNAIVDADSPAMLRLLPEDASAAAGEDYLIHIADTEDDGDLLRARVSSSHPGPRPVLQFMSKAFIQAQLDLAPKPTPFVVD